MERPLVQIYEILQKMVGLHRQMLEITRAERESLIQANLEEIQKVLAIKQSLIEAIHQAETQRIKSTAELAVIWRKTPAELTLKNIILKVQGVDQKAAEQFRSAFNTLTLLIQRVMDQNADNRSLLDQSMEHIQKMKQNVLGESSQKGTTYTPQGQQLKQNTSPRFISKEI